MLVVRPIMGFPLVVARRGRAGEDFGVGEYVTGQIGMDRIRREPHPSMGPGGVNAPIPPAAGHTWRDTMKVEIT
jgi:hypothetical protein